MNDNSEFTCEVVRVLEVSKHPNADKLSIVKVGGKDGPYHYSLVSGDSYSPGDLTVLVGVDSLVPVNNEEWEYCKKRLDYKVGSSHYRIRRAKLRGIATDGVLVNGVLKMSDYVGNDVSQRLGILKYETPSVDNGPTPPQSDKGPVTLNKKLKRLIPDYSVTNLRKVANLFEEGEQVEVTEKIHGSNIRFGRLAGSWWKMGRGDSLFVGSHHAIKSDHRSIWNRFWARVLGKVSSKSHYYGIDVWSKWVLSRFSTAKLPKDYIFYGEIFGPGIQKGYEYGQKEVDVRVYDVWDIKAQQYLDVDARAILCAEWSIPTVPPIFVNFSVDDMKMRAEQPSNFTYNNLKEGDVYKSLDGKRRGKWVGDKYREEG